MATSNDMHGLAIMPKPSAGMGIMMGDGADEPQFPSLTTRLYTDMDLPDGDFFFLGIGHVTKKSKEEEDDGDTCYINEIDVHAIQPIQSIEDEKKALPDADLLGSNFDDAVEHMQSLKADNAKKSADNSYDGDGPDDESQAEDDTED
jgi:hypothetical protein